MAWTASRFRGIGDDGLALHVLLSAMFGKAVLQPFRLFDPARGAWSLYAYTAQDAAALSATAAIAAPPEMLAVLSPAALRSKPLPALPPGTAVGFDLRARPIRRQTPAQGGGERDAFQLPDEAGVGAGAEADRAAVYHRWLTDRLGQAADLHNTRMSTFRRSRVVRGGRGIDGPDATLQGTLTVRDEAAFAALLARGVGRHCAYGFGMLLLRPPDRA
jgi:CRISPR system Cascade subunit CasE